MIKGLYTFKVLSFALHPIFIPVYTTLLYLKIFEQVLTDELTNYLLTLVIIGTLTLPLLTILLLKKTKIIESIFLKTQKERIIPLLLTGLYTYITARLLMTENINSPLNSYLIGIVVTLSWILIFSRRMKVSLHTAALSSSLGFIIYISNIFYINLQPLIIFIILIIGAVSTARIKLKAHSCKEIYVGVVFGILPQLGFVFLY